MCRNYGEMFRTKDTCVKHGNCCGHCRQYLRGAYWGCTIAGNREIHDDDSTTMVESEEGNQYLKNTRP